MRRLLLLVLFLSASCYAEVAPQRNPVVPEELFDLIRKADRLVVKDSALGDTKILFESNKKADLDALLRSLNIQVPEEEFFYMCLGSPVITIYSGKEELVSFSNHHGESISSSIWSSHAPLVEPEKWIAWFDARNMPGPRSEVNETRARRDKSKKSWNKWIAAMPKSLESLWSVDGLGMVEIKPLILALEKDIPEQESRVLSLYKWFGSGEGRWSGYPSYESAAEDMLLKYPTEILVKVALNTNLSSTQLEGAARLFGGWDFYKKRPEDLIRLPEKLKEKLWEHVKSSTDNDKLGRAKRAFKTSEK